ncbi:MAG TPA: hypothetical protein ENK18_05585 [Deltaproteobacteria bacterium]|nr:hypothetical protein [Deltaproteobacteria bacterium]
MVRLVPLASLLCCTAVHPTDTGQPPLSLEATPGPIMILSHPSGGLHHHATLAWGDEAFAVSWVTGLEPETACWFQRFDTSGVGLGGPVQLHAPETYCDKPDLVRSADGYLVGFDDRRGGVWLRSIPDPGGRARPASLLHESTLELDAVDLALGAAGSGIAIWTQSGAPWMGPDDGEIAWRAFEPGLQPEGPVLLAEQSSRKTADAAPLPGGGFVAVWARHHDHPSRPGEVLYEVHGRLYPDQGDPHSFRADDLDGAWPSRPAVAVGPGGGLAVSWRDKTASEGDPAGAYGRLLDRGGEPLGPSVALSPPGAGVGDGDRVVVAWAGAAAVFAWEETGPDALPGVWLSALDGTTAAILVDRLAISEPGGVRDERPSIAVRPVDGGHEVMVVWETVRPGSGVGEGLRARSVVLREVR